MTANLLHRLLVALLSVLAVTATQGCDLAERVGATEFVEQDSHHHYGLADQGHDDAQQNENNTCPPCHAHCQGGHASCVHIVILPRAALASEPPDHLVANPVHSSRVVLTDFPSSLFRPPIA